MAINVELLPKKNHRSKKLEKKPIVSDNDDEELIRIHTTHDDGC
mgnify:CR=1 FL=1